MPDTLHRLFVECSIKQLRQMAGRIESCLGKLSPEQIWARGSESENAIGNLVLHLCGNVRQWIVAGAGARPDHRDRDSEFAARGGRTTAELAALLHAVVEDAAGVLAVISAERLAETVTIQNYEVSVLQAIYHSVEHFSGHTGQIIFATKMLTSSDLGFHRHLSTTAAHGHKTP